MLIKNPWVTVPMWLAENAGEIIDNLQGTLDNSDIAIANFA